MLGCVTVLAVAPLVAAPKAALPGVRDVRFWNTGDTTRVAIEVTGDFEHMVQRLENPDRLFFDISPAKLSLKDGRTSTITVGNALVKQIRLAERKAGTIRVVFDLEKDADYTVSRLTNPERLIVELQPKSKTPAKVSRNAKQPETKQAETKEPAAKETASKETAPKETAKESAAETVLKPVVLASIAPIPVPAPSKPGPTKSVPAKVTLPAPSEAATPKAAPPADLPEPTAAARNSNGERSLARLLGLKLGRVVIDPGHGGHDQGTHSRSGLLEKDLVLDVSKRLAVMLKDRMGVDVMLTRSDDTFIALEERSRIANEGHADLFLSIHANSSPAKNVGGVETYYLNFNTGREDQELAARENSTTQRSMSDLKEITSKILLRSNVDESREFALHLQDSLHKTAAKNNKDAKDRGVKRAPFVVLIGSEMPSVLAEIGFLSNSRDESLLKGDEYRDRVAEALYKGIAAYAQTLSRSGVQVAQAK
jgi:N-acetylmuramoyl-L-alanine amidase